MANHYRFMNREQAEEDLTFTFFRDGSVRIVDNRLERSVSPKELRGTAYEFYISKRIQFIRSLLSPDQTSERNNGKSARAGKSAS